METPGVEPGSDKEIDKTSTCLAKRLGLTADRQFGEPTCGDFGCYVLPRPNNLTDRPVHIGVYPSPLQVLDLVDGPLLVS